jgi:hypothetical protein
MAQEAETSVEAVREDAADGETAGSVGTGMEVRHETETGTAPETDIASGREIGGGEASHVGTGAETGAGNEAGSEAAIGSDIGGRAASETGTGRKGTAPRKAARKRKPKRVPWSARRERIFLETLAQTAKVAAAVRASGLSDSNVYRHRQCDEGFRGRWAAALAEGFERLEAMMLDRALNGVRKPVWYGGKRVGTMTEYSDRTALALLAQHRGTVRDAGVPAHDMSTDEWRAHWDRRFKGMRRRLGGEE